MKFRDDKDEMVCKVGMVFRRRHGGELYILARISAHLSLDETLALISVHCGNRWNDGVTFPITSERKGSLSREEWKAICGNNAYANNDFMPIGMGEDVLKDNRTVVDPSTIEAGDINAS